MQSLPYPGLIESLVKSPNVPSMYAPESKATEAAARDSLLKPAQPTQCLHTRRQASASSLLALEDKKTQ